jgi:hypothetical protein
VNIDNNSGFRPSVSSTTTSFKTVEVSLANYEYGTPHSASSKTPEVMSGMAITTWHGLSLIEPTAIKLQSVLLTKLESVKRSVEGDDFGVFFLKSALPRHVCKQSL